MRHEKRTVLIVAHHLTIGGAQKSMVTALKAIDYEKNDVTLYVRKKRLDLLNEIDPRVHVVVNEDRTHYYRKPYAVWLLLLSSVCRAFHLSGREQAFQNSLSEYIRERMMAYEKKRYFQGKKYDVAISYIQGYTADLAAEAIDAERKYLFYHSSTDEAHAFHERILPKYDAVIAVGDEIKRLLQTFYPAYKNPIHVLYNCVDAEEIRQKSRQAVIEVPPDRTKLCTCGRLNPVKGFDLALKAAKKLKDDGERFLWYFVGDGPERSKLEGMIREMGLEDCITITGMQANPYPWMNACQIYVQPSFQEAHPLSIIEAQILCKPVVSTATVGGQALVKDWENGLLCDIREDALADAVRQLMRSPDMRTKITERLKRADHAADFTRYAEAWARLLEGTL